MILKNLATWLASRPRKQPCTTVVMHATAGGNLSGAISTLRIKGFSYHYLIDKDGTITKCVPYERVAFHAGVSTGPEGDNVNRYSVGISFVNLNDGKDPITPLQMRAARELVFALKSAIPTIKYVTCHYAISWGRKTDPKLFDLQGFASDVHLQPWKESQATWRTF